MKTMKKISKAMLVLLTLLFVVAAGSNVYAAQNGKNDRVRAHQSGECTYNCEPNNYCENREACRFPDNVPRFLGKTGNTDAGNKFRSLSGACQNLCRRISESI